MTKVLLELRSAARLALDSETAKRFKRLSVPRPDHYFVPTVYSVFLAVAGPVDHLVLIDHSGPIAVVRLFDHFVATEHSGPDAAIGLIGYCQSNLGLTLQLCFTRILYRLKLSSLSLELTLSSLSLLMSSLLLSRYLKSCSPSLASALALFSHCIWRRPLISFFTRRRRRLSDYGT